MDPDVELHTIDEFLTHYDPKELIDVLGQSSDSSDSDPNKPNSDNSFDIMDRDEVLQKWGRKSRSKLRRLSPKDELRFLGEEELKLEQKLRSLEEESRLRAARIKETSLNEASDPQRRDMWRRIALSQLERRLKSEDENSKLREIVAVQILEAKNLRRILKRRNRIEMMEDVLFIKGLNNMPKISTEVRQDIVNQMLHDVDELHYKIDDLFAAKRMGDVGLTGIVRNLNADVIDGVYFELLQKRLMPFSFRKVNKAVWYTLGQIVISHMQEIKPAEDHVRLYPHHSDSDDNTIKMMFFEADSSGKELLCTQKVVRRYADAKRQIFVCKMLTEQKVGNQEGDLTTTTLQIVVQPADTDTSIINMYFSAARQPPPGDKHPALSTMIELWDELIPRFNVDVETILMDNFCNGGSN